MTKRILEAADDNFDYQTELQDVQSTFGRRAFRVSKPKSEFPQLFITVPDSWPSIKLAPLYDVHIGSREHDKELFHKHRNWMTAEPNVLTWNGGDMFENVTPQQGKMGHTPMSPEEQLVSVVQELAPVQHKMLFSLPGNHENRTFAASGMSASRRLANDLQLPYFPDYVFCTIFWRGNRFRLLAHHGAGGATTAGAQRNSARKELPWVRADLIWTGHLHQPLVDIVFATETDQKTQEVYERDSVVLISPSYLRYFGGYAATMRLAPGLRGLSVCELQEDGRIDVNVHARGRRL